MILGIDPGNIESAYVLLDENLKPIEFGKIKNEELKEKLIFFNMDSVFQNYECAIEMIASYGMSVGATVFDTCVWIGRFVETIPNLKPKYIYRKDEKMNLCGTMRAKDTNIRQALIDRFGVVGTKKAQGFFYGFKSDIWAAMAVAVTYHDLYLKGENNEPTKEN